MANPLITDPIDLLLDTSTHDLVIDTDLHLSTGLAAVSQEVKIALLMVKGEWFMDLEEGVPYFEREGVPAKRAILGQKFNEKRALAEFRKAILTVSTVSRIESLKAEFNRTTRALRITFKVRTVFGDTVADTLARTI